MRFFLLFFCFSCGLVLASENSICVRNYFTESYNVCDQFPDMYTYVFPAKIKDKKICTKMYTFDFCKIAPEYVVIAAEKGGEICALNNDQPAVVNLCASVPAQYDYAFIEPPGLMSDPN